MAVKFANLASSTLASSLSNTATSISVTSSSSFPTLGSGDYFYASIGEGTGSEIVKVTGVSSNTFTVVRGQDGTSAQNWSSGSAVALRVVAAALDDIAEQAQTAADTESVSISGDTMTGPLNLTSTLLSIGHSSGNNWMPYTDGNFYIRAPNTFFDNNVKFQDGSGSLELTGDTNSNYYMEATGEIRIRPNGTTTNKIVLNSSHITAPAYQVSGTTVIDSSRNLTNIGSISSSGNITRSSATTGTAYIRIDNTSAGTNNYAALQLDTDQNHTYKPGLLLNSSTNTNYGGANTLSLWQYHAYPISLVTNNTVRLTIGGSGGFDFKGNALSSVGTIGSSGQHSITGGSTGSILLKIGSATQTEYVDLQMVSNSGVAEFFKAGSTYTSWGGASAFNIYNSNGLIAFHPGGVANVLQVDTTGLNVGASRTIRMNGTTVIDASRNLTNIVSSTSTGLISNIRTSAFSPDGSSAGLRLEYSGGDVDGDIGSGIVFAQRWWSGSTSNVRTGGIAGFKNSGSGTFGGGLKFYTQPQGGSNMNLALTLDKDKNAQFAGTISSGGITANGSVNLGTTTDGSRRFKWYNDDNHTLYYDDNLLTTESADVFTYYQNVVFRHRDSTNAVIIGGSAGTISSGGITSAGDVEVKGGNELRVYRTDNATYGSIQYLTGAGGLKFRDVNGDGMTFSGASSDYAKIDTSGNFLVGKSSSSFNTVGVEIQPTRILATRSGGQALQVNRKGSDGAIISLHRDGTEIGSIQGRSGDLLIGTADVGLRFDDNAQAYIPFNVTTSAGRDAAIDLGHATVRYKDLYLSGKITADFSSARFFKYRSGSVADLEVLSDNNSNDVVRITGTGTADIFKVVDGSKNVFEVADGGTTTANGEFKVQSGSAYITHLNYQDNGQNYISQATSGGLTQFRNSNGMLMEIAASGNVTIANDLTVSGNFSVLGTTTTLNTATLDVEDKNITLNYGTGDTSGSANDAGITIQDAVNSTTDASIKWKTAGDYFDFSHKININGDLQSWNVRSQDFYVLNSAGSAWHKWGERNSDRINLNVNTIETYGASYFTGGSGTTPAVHIRSSGNSWSEGFAVHPGSDNGYALAFFRTRASYTNNTNTWAIGNLGGTGFQNYFGLLKKSLTGSVADKTGDAIFTVNPSNGRFKFGFDPYVGANKIWHAGNDGASSGLDADTVDGFHVDSNNGGLVKSYQDQNGGTFHSTISEKRSSMGMGFLSDGPNSNTDWYRFIQPSYREGSGGSNVWQTQLAFYGTGGDFYLRQREGGSFGSSGWGSWVRVWTSATDGSGSGLDADFLDGIQGSQFLRSDAADTGAPSAATALTLGYIQNNNIIIGNGTTSFADTYDNSPWYGIGRTNLVGWNSGQHKAQMAFYWGLTLRSAQSRIELGPASNGPILFGDGGTNNWAKLTNTGMYIGTSTNNVVWHAGNDGSGSGLDADTLDGIDSGSFLRSNVPDNYTSGTLSFNSSTALKMLNGSNFDASSGDVYVNLRVIRNAGTANLDGLYIGYLNSNSGLTRIFGGGQGSGGIYISGSGANDIKYNNSSVFWHAGNDGSGSGLDADLLDGVQGASYLRSDASDTYSGVLTLNGMLFQNNSNTTRNLKIQGPSGTDIGISGFTSNGTHAFQIYGTNGGTYGFLDGNWGNWDLQATKNGSLTKRVSGSMATIWHSSNDGAGSGLDADLLDGQHGSYYAPVAGSTSFRPVTAGLYGTGHGGSLLPIWQYNSAHHGYGFGYVEGNPDSFRFDVTNNLVSGTPDFEISENVARVNGNTVWHAGNDGSGSGLDADTVDGVQADRIPFGQNATGTNNTQPSQTLKSGFYDIYNNNTPTATWYSYVNIRHNNVSNNHGHQIAGSFYDNNLWNRNINNGTFGSWSKSWSSANDGSGSGLDADLLDGNHGSHYLNYNNLTNTPTIPTNNNQLTNGAGFLTNGSSETITYVYRIHSSDSTSPDSFGYDNRYQTFNYGVSSGVTGPLISFGGLGSGYPMQITGNYGGSGNLFKVRTRNGDTSSWNSWRTLWHDGNDGSGSGLDADTVDGIQGSSFLRSDAPDTFGSQLTSANNVGIRFVAANANDSNDGKIGAGLFASGLNIVGAQTSPGTGRQVRIWGDVIDSGGNKFWNANNDGSGSGLDADLLDGQHGSYYYSSANYPPRTNFENTYNNLTSNTGSGSDLNLTFTGSSKSGHFDCWSANNLPPSSTHVQGIQTRHTTTTHYGWQIAGQYNQAAIWKRYVSNGSFSSWHQMWTSGTDGSGSGLDADLLDGMQSKSATGATGGNEVLRSHSNGYLYHSNWILVGTAGIYSGTNSAHFSPNQTTSYGSWITSGSRGGYDGIVFDSGGDVAVMFDVSGNGGFFKEGHAWIQYYNVSNTCTAFGASTTSSSYQVYVHGGFYATGNVTAYSDRRIKENIVTIDNALEKVNQLEGVYYNRVDDPDKNREIGFIAQDVNEVTPELVTYAEDVDQYGVKYQNATALLVEAVKTLTQQVKDLQAEIEELKNA